MPPIYPVNVARYLLVLTTSYYLALVRPVFTYLHDDGSYLIVVSTEYHNRSRPRPMWKDTKNHPRSSSLLSPGVGIQIPSSSGVQTNGYLGL
ncbi:hypothetical protein L208DRAFT_1402387 [Tricholoma matsutake]|nr:hypothetical protein L208DRAFT_1402387 [Tricholoma matsutake 945]